MHDFPPNVNWRWTTLLATILGYVVCGDFTVKEQLAIGNWILQIGQTVMTNSTYQDLIETRIIGNEKINLNSAEYKRGGSPWLSSSFDYSEFYNSFRAQITDEELALLSIAIKRINDELEKIKKEMI